MNNDNKMVSYIRGLEKAKVTLQNEIEEYDKLLNKRHEYFPESVLEAIQNLIVSNTNEIKKIESIQEKMKEMQKLVNNV